MGALLTGGVNTGLVSGNLAGSGVPAATLIPQMSAVVIAWFFGVEQLIGTTFAALMQTWKASAVANGLSLKTLMYFPGGAPHWVTSNGNSNWLTQAYNLASMWIYSSAAGTGTTDLVDYYSSSSPQSWANYGSTNAQAVTDFTYQGVTNVNAGMSFAGVTAQYHYDVLMQGLGLSKYGETDGGNPGYLVANAYLDGFFIDNHFPWAQGTGGGTTTGTWNGVGTTPVSGSAAVSNELMNGCAALYAAFRAVKSNITLMPNSGVAQALLNQISSLTSSYAGSMDYQFNEAVIGSPGCAEENFNSPIDTWLTSGMIPAEGACNSTGQVVYHQVGRLDGVAFSTLAQSSWVPADWQACRNIFATAMMRDKSIYMLNCGVNQYGAPGLMDEQVQGGNYNWLTAGTQRQDAPQSAPSTLSGISGSGVWARRFPNGWVLRNPRGNGARTITVPSTLSRLSTRGYGDSSVNTGLQVASGSGNVTLQDGDGLFLSGVG